MIRTLSAAAAIALLGSASAANAAPILYNLTLTGAVNQNPTGGTGSFSIEGSTFSKSGNEFFQYSGSPSGDLLLSLTFVIDGHTFDKTDSLGGDQVFFQNGNLAGVTYLGIDGANVQISLNAGALSYTYSNSITGHFSQGRITAALAPTTPAVPEPATWAMMLLGFGGLGYAMRRRPKVATRIRFA